MGRPLDWMYSKEKAEFYTRHIWELDKLYAKYKGEDHSFNFIVSDLRKNNSDLSFSGDTYSMVFQCWKNVMVIQDKWNPFNRREYFTETVIPNDKMSFIRSSGRSCLRRKDPSSICIYSISTISVHLQVFLLLITMTALSDSMALKIQRLFLTGEDGEYYVLDEKNNELIFK